MAGEPSRSVLPSNTRIILTSPSGSSSKKAILKADNETPWTANALPSSIHLLFPEAVLDATHLALTFQGGFVGTTAMVYVAMKSRNQESDVDLGLMMGGRIYPEDKNRRQVFRIPYPPNVEQLDPHSQAKADSVAETRLSDSPTGPIIRTEVPPNPNGNGEPASPLVAAPGSRNGQVDGQGEEWLPPAVAELKIEFEASSDDYGRVTVYQVELLG